MLGIVARHPGQVIDIQFTVAAKALSLVAEHLVPVCGARAGNSQIVKRAIVVRQKKDSVLYHLDGRMNEAGGRVLQGN